MPLDDEIIEEGSMEGEENIEDNPTDNPTDIDDTEVDGDESLVQDEEEKGSIPETEEPETLPGEQDEEPEEEPEEENSLSDNSMEDDEGTEEELEEEISTLSLENIEVCSDLEAFESSTVQVDLYQYTILNRLEFIQYALCIVIALLFLQIFVRYKK